MSGTRKDDEMPKVAEVIFSKASDHSSYLYSVILLVVPHGISYQNS